MAKRPDTLETLLLALELLRRIPRKNKITARELQEQLQNAGMDRDLRTIQRMLERLCCTNQKRAEITPAPDAATPQQAQAPLPGAQVV